LLFLPNAACLAEKQQYQLNSLWFDRIGIKQQSLTHKNVEEEKVKFCPCLYVHPASDFCFSKPLESYEQVREHSTALSQNKTLEKTCIYV
jgi:hypothetical protein